MSGESPYRFSKNQDIQKLAENHYEHDLSDSDRKTLEKAASKIENHAIVGATIGVSLGIFLAFRTRQNRTRMLNAFRTAERPTHVKFADGREEVIPDIAPLLKPSIFGDIATYSFLGIGGLLLGRMTGILTGSSSAKRTISKDPEVLARVETAFKKFKADVLRKEADAIDGGKSVTSMLGL